MRGKRKKSVSVLRQRLGAGLCRRRLFPFIRGETGSRSALTSPPSHATTQHSVNTSRARRGPRLAARPGNWSRRATEHVQRPPPVRIGAASSASCSRAYLLFSAPPLRQVFGGRIRGDRERDSKILLRVGRRRGRVGTRNHWTGALGSQFSTVIQVGRPDPLHLFTEAFSHPLFHCTLVASLWGPPFSHFTARKDWEARSGVNRPGFQSSGKSFSSLYLEIFFVFKMGIKNRISRVYYEEEMR